jgi:Tfp pilus assembly protein PilF
MYNNYKNLKIHSLLFLVMGLFFLNGSYAQSLQEENKKVIKETNKLLKNAEDDLAENDFYSAEASFRKAVSKDPESVKAKYNMANMYYGKEKPSQAESRLKQAAKVAETKDDKHRIFHNLGNTFMEQKKYKEAVEAYKNALRNNPNDEETRYNLALAKKMLEEEQQENEGGGGDEDKEEKDKDKKEENKGDQGEKEQDKKEGEDKEDKGDPKEDQNEPEEQNDKGKPKDQKEEDAKPQPQQPQPGQLSPEQVKSLLEAMNNEEKKVQDKINAEKAKGVKTKSGKDW